MVMATIFNMLCLTAKLFRAVHRCRNDALTLYVSSWRSCKSRKQIFDYDKKQWTKTIEKPLIIGQRNYPITIHHTIYSYCTSNPERHYLFSFLLLSSSSVFQPSSVPGGMEYYLYFGKPCTEYGDC